MQQEETMTRSLKIFRIMARSGSSRQYGKEMMQRTCLSQGREEKETEEVRVNSVY